MGYLSFDSKESFLNADKIKHAILTMEWLSAIACDDWIESTQTFEEFHDEITVC